MMSELTCPICLENYYMTEFSAEVCKKHENWIVTRCQVCENYCFSDCRSLCPVCVPIDDIDHISNANTR